MSSNTEAICKEAEDRPVVTTFEQLPNTVSIGLVGGKRIISHSLQHLLAESGIETRHIWADEASFEEFLASDEICDYDAVLLVLPKGPFGTFHRIRESLSNANCPAPLVVLSEQTNRGYIYAALRSGAKAYVNLDADPEELIKAINAVCQNQVYLAPEAAEMLVNDLGSVEVSQKGKLPQLELSRRETEVVELLCEGLSSKEIARHLHISAKTVENHRYNIYRKCGVDSLPNLMRHAIQQGLVTI